MRKKPEPKLERVISNRDQVTGKFTSPQPILKEKEHKSFWAGVPVTRKEGAELIPTVWRRGSNPERNKDAYVPKGGSSRKRRVYGSGGSLERVRGVFGRRADMNPHATVQHNSGKSINLKEAQAERAPSMGVMPETAGHPGALKIGDLGEV